MIEPYDEEGLEQLYWEFDSIRAKSGDERLAFKGKLRWYASKYADNKVEQAYKNCEDYADSVAWIEHLQDVIKSYNIPVKTYTVGKPWYCLKESS